jgi:hypothetical protein
LLARFLASKAARAPAPYKAAANDFGKAVFGLANSGGGGGGAAKAGGSLATRLGGRLGGQGAPASVGTKVLVGDLARDITTADVKELFETVGEVRLRASGSPRV